MAGRVPFVRSFSPSGPGQSAVTVSGTVIASGEPDIPTTFSGPHYIKRQSLDIEYVRVPHAQCLSASGGLAGQVDYKTSMAWTGLILRATPKVSIKKSYESYNTSAWQQPQVFEVQALSADYNGTTYGSLNTAEGGNALGPAGSIITIQDGYSRVLWNDSIHTQSETGVSSFTGYNYTAALSGDHGEYSEAASIWSNFESFLIKTGVGTTKKPGEPFMIKSWIPAQINGDYNTDKESLSLIPSLLDLVGNRVELTPSQLAGPGIDQDGWWYGFIINKPAAPVGKLTFPNSAGGGTYDICFIKQYDTSLHYYL